MKMTKEESMRWVNHAIAFYESLGKKQKDLAKDLGIEESRLSELKSVHKPAKVSDNLVKKVIEICGAPKRDPGRFELVELYDNLESFFNQYITVTLNRFHRNAHQSFMDQWIVDGILEKCRYENDDREQKVASINQMVRSKEFAEFCKDPEFNSKLNKNSYDELLPITKHYGLIINDRETFHRLRQLWALVEAQPDFYFGNKTNRELDLVVPNIPVVLTGNRIAAFMSPHRTIDYPANTLVAHELSVLNSGYLSTPYPMPSLDCWRTIRVEVYLSENMNYHILIHMSDGELDPSDLSYTSQIHDGFEWCNYDAAFGEKDRIAVIKNVSTLDLFKQIEELKKWQGLEEDNLYELKKNIAKAGGHIPGAYVLI